MPRVAVSPFAAAVDLAAALRRREVSSAELLELYLERIARFNPAINAIVIPDYDRARQAARAADRALEQGAPGELLGLPVTIKDTIDVASLPTVCGVRSRANRAPETADARAVARLRAAGVVIMGKTNTPAYAGDWTTENRVFGRTNNPWNLDYTPGGSSGGAGAALAAGLTGLELGSDIGGSVRFPASFCGVYGHRPSDTLVPRSGHFPGFQAHNRAWVLNAIGPLAREARDLDLALGIIQGPEAGDDVAWRVELPQPRHERLQDFRVAVLPWFDWVPVDPEVRAATDRLAGELRRVGARVGIAQPSLFEHLREYIRLYLRLLAVMMGMDLRDEERHARAAAAGQNPDEFRAVMDRAAAADAVDFVRWQAEQERYRGAYREFFRDWDVLISPVTITPPFRHPELPYLDRTLEIEGQTVSYEWHTIYPAISTCAGQPATAFPAGRDRRGLPLGLQAIGPILEDRTPIRFAQLVAETFGGFEAPPGYG